MYNKSTKKKRKFCTPNAHTDDTRYGYS